MSGSARSGMRIGLLVLLVVTSGCATVPREVVLLSQGMGEDLGTIELSYRALIRTDFQDLRQQIEAFIDMRWKPAYLRGYIQTGDLVALATASDPNDVLEGVGDWVDGACVGYSRRGEKVYAEAIHPVASVTKNRSLTQAKGGVVVHCHR